MLRRRSRRLQETAGYFGPSCVFRQIGVEFSSHPAFNGLAGCDSARDRLRRSARAVFSNRRGGASAVVKRIVKCEADSHGRLDPMQFFAGEGYGPTTLGDEGSLGAFTNVAIVQKVNSVPTFVTESLHLSNKKRCTGCSVSYLRG